MSGRDHIYIYIFWSIHWFGCKDPTFSSLFYVKFLANVSVFRGGFLHHIRIESFLIYFINEYDTCLLCIHPKLMWLLNLIMVYHKFNSNFKNHINFK
jgi:hypothetical protein